MGSAGVHYYYYKNYLEEKPDKFSDDWFRSKQDTKEDIWAVQVWDSIMPSWASVGKKHALKKYDQFALNTSCFGGSSGSNIILLMQFHEIFVTKMMNKLIYHYYS